jgi:hypothetical protein
MQSQKNKWIGVGIMMLGLLVGAFFVWFFKLDGKVIDFNDPSLVMESIIMVSCPIIGLYFGLLFYGGKKIAFQLGGGLGVLLVLAYVIGFLLHH